jgi:hypothetical protein
MAIGMCLSLVKDYMGNSQYMYPSLHVAFALYSGGVFTTRRYSCDYERCV